LHTSGESFPSCWSRSIPVSRSIRHRALGIQARYGEMPRRSGEAAKADRIKMKAGAIITVALLVVVIAIMFAANLAVNAILWQSWKTIFPEQRLILDGLRSTDPRTRWGSRIAFALILAVIALAVFVALALDFRAYGPASSSVRP
jgi:uncharacterized integral membrane protein